MKALITGGCGFLGSNLAVAMLARGDEVVVFDSLYRIGASANLEWLASRPGLRFVHGDVRNANDVERVIAEVQPDAVAHLAGQVAMTTSLSNPRMDFEVNALGTLNVLEALRRHAPEAALVYSSTNKVYGDLETLATVERSLRWELEDFPAGLPESIAFDPHSPYGCSKGAADVYIRDYARLFGIRAVVFRHSSIYGGRQFSTFDQGWLGWFCEQAMRQAADPSLAPFTISGDGKQVRDVLHADDAVAAYLAALGRAHALAGAVFNIGGGMANSLSLLELFGKLEARTGQAPRFRRIAPRESDQRVFVADIGKARRELDWEPHVSADVGLDRMLEWVRASLPR